MKPARALLLPLVFEALVWYGIAAAFLFGYLERSGTSFGAALAHLELLTLVVAGIVCLRFVIWRWVPGERAPRWICAFLLSWVLALLLIYYALVLISLQSWGRVITWNLISTYSAQGLDFAAALGYSPAALAAAAAALLAALIGLMALVTIWPDWTAALARGKRARAVAFVALGGLVLVVLRLHGFAMDPPARAGEPISLTFFPERALQFRGNQTGDSPLREQAENAARSAYAPSATFHRRKVILIVADALRPDRMGAYGHARKTTPLIERWGEQGAMRKFDRVWAACAESACGLMAIANGRYLYELPRRSFSLPEALRRHGYAVHMILGGDHTNFYGLREAYGEVDSYFDGASAAGHYMNDDALVVERTAALPEWNGLPVMFHFHLMSTHELGARHPESLRHLPSATYVGKVLRRGRSLAPEEHAFNFYDNGVIQLDLTVDRILQLLRRKGYLREALVVITADHGEGLGEHGTYGHAKSLHEVELRVPLLLLSFGYRPGAPAEPAAAASQIDIAPTILAELGIPRPTTWTGQPLQERRSRDVLYLQEEGQFGLLDLRDGGCVWKYWTDLRTGEEFAYELAADPQEANNLVRSVPAERHRDWRKRISVVAVAAAR